jgi:hypothetical protein
MAYRPVVRSNIQEVVEAVTDRTTAEQGVVERDAVEHGLAVAAIKIATSAKFDDLIGRLSY